MSELYIQSARKRMQEVASIARQMDPECYYVVEDVRLASTAEQKRATKPAKAVAEPSVAESTMLISAEKSRPSLNVGAASGGTAK